MKTSTDLLTEEIYALRIACFQDEVRTILEIPARMIFDVFTILMERTGILGRPNCGA